MALIKCSECGKECSESAQRCPNCGDPIISLRAKSMRNAKNLRIVIYVFYGIFFIGFLGAVVSAVENEDIALLITSFLFIAYAFLVDIFIRWQSLLMENVSEMNANIKYLVEKEQSNNKKEEV